MKKIVALILALAAAASIGYYAGAKAVIYAPKWVEYGTGYDTIVTDFGGNLYEDVADKTYDHYTELHYSVYGVKR